MAEETIKNLIDSIDNAEEEIQNFLSKITSEGFNTQDLGDMTTIAAFFSLPDELFDGLKEHVIQEIIRECNDPAFLNNISYSIKKDNITADQLTDELSGIEKIIDEYESEVLTPNKKEFLKRLMYGMYNIILQMSLRMMIRLLFRLKLVEKMQKFLDMLMLLMRELTFILRMSM